MLRTDLDHSRSHLHSRLLAQGGIPSPRDKNQSKPQFPPQKNISSVFPPQAETDFPFALAEPRLSTTSFPAGRIKAGPALARHQRGSGSQLCGIWHPLLISQGVHAGQRHIAPLRAHTAAALTAQPSPRSRKDTRHGFWGVSHPWLAACPNLEHLPLESHDESRGIWGAKERL